MEAEKVKETVRTADPESKSFSDEKHSTEKVDKAESIQEIGEVYDDIRIIDLGEDGRERPIGEPPLFRVADSVHVANIHRLDYRNRPGYCYPPYLSRRRPDASRLYIPHVVLGPWTCVLRRRPWADLRMSYCISQLAST